ncbi:zinc-dependent metalloprotease [Cyclobacterium marinum]|uniref:Putative extracellular metal-dependent peptidase n=1 Tax=Cyclobacterium marinum (strain ATCC 25205 / DSM 745 / LMG 13164 / NCIMB 1802) TaxID=880070 RepID=G0J417_CYCMS|nr:zinc-dependent metalloprotease [Cyclobacterium marinum]AEL26683.1 putative extracellular metal-dependent peptidase [Cyclobacterium marinum DSM 745]
MSFLKSLIFLFIPIFGFSTQQNKGFFDFKWQEKDDRIILIIDQLGEEFLYVNALATGIGSNDLGLDRGQLGGRRIVKFEKVGDKILLIQPNYNFRGTSNNQAEANSIEEAFAKSVIGGFPILNADNGHYRIDITNFLLRDAHGIANTLSRKNQGHYTVDQSKSAIYLPNTISFPDNTEFEAMITFKGEAKGAEIRSVTPDAGFVTVNMHHSFIRLPDNNYKPRVFHTSAGYFGIAYSDYSTPIYEDINKRLITRHRLEKKDPTARMSEAVEPIVYYLDPGCPEPVKSALLEGAKWWNQAFEAAGYINAFQVKVLPESAHPLDIRYNVIQWVHRSTRGWSYGSTITDPRTGEIIKGHVSLGSLRVRQDFMIAQGILSPFANSNYNHDELMELALARLRQLSAHEIGHTIGLAHNFAASADHRASVMDYPHPLINILNGKADISKAYDDKIGEWDKRAVLYGYQDFGPQTDEEAALAQIVKETLRSNTGFISDKDARARGGLHPSAHLWDNGSNAVDELERINEVRAYSLKNFGAKTIPDGRPYSELENILVPLYYMNRYQVEAVSKLIGGTAYSYAVKGYNEPPNIHPIEGKTQELAVDALLKTIEPNYLQIPQHIKALIPPPAYGYNKDRESFAGNTGFLLDPLAAAASATNNLFRFMFQEERLARINQQKEYNLKAYYDQISQKIFNTKVKTNTERQINQLVQASFVLHLIQAGIHNPDILVRAISKYYLQEEIKGKHLTKSGDSFEEKAHAVALIEMITNAYANPENWTIPQVQEMPPGSPIGCEGFHDYH